MSLVSFVDDVTHLLFVVLAVKDGGGSVSPVKLFIPSFSETGSPWTVCTFGVIPEQGKCVEIFLFVPMRSTK